MAAVSSSSAGTESEVVPLQRVSKCACDVGVKGWAQCGKLIFNSCANGGVTRLGGTRLLLAR